MVNACLTKLEASVPKLTKREKKRKAASRVYAIDDQVLDNLGRIAATAGSDAEAR
jgi:hypothetical protein